MTVRKNFVFDDAVALHLEELAAKEQKSMTALVQEMIEERYREIEREEKLAAAHRIIGSSPGLYVGKSIQSIKAEMDV